MRRKRRTKQPKRVESFRHDEAKRPNLPSAEHQSVMSAEEQTPIRRAVKRRNRDLDPQLVWRGKSYDDEFEVQAPPLFIQEKVPPKALIDDLKRVAAEGKAPEEQASLFDDFNGLPSAEARTEFYQHEANWSNRMILGDSLQVMASLADREGFRGKVQCIYIDPPYGIKFNSNFQWSTTSRDVKDGKTDHITREPEQVKAFRDTWRDGIHSYLSYLRDRLTMARELLTESGSVFVQIGDENVHRVRALMDEVFGERNFVSEITFKVTANLVAGTLGRDSDYLLWYARDRESVKYRQLFRRRTLADDVGGRYSRVQLTDWSRMLVSKTRRTLAELENEGHSIFRHDNITSQGATPSGTVGFEYQEHVFHPGQARHWTTTKGGLDRLGRAERLGIPSKNSLAYVRFFTDFPVSEHTSVWRDTQTGAFTDRKVFVVQTNTKVVQRCILMTTDPGDLVLDPTCGSGTTAYVAEQWGRRWITIDTSRVALALARARIMGARYAYYFLSDSREGQEKEGEITRAAPKQAETYGRLRQGFVYERVPHVTLKAIANNAEIDVIWERMQPAVEAALSRLNEALASHSEPFKVTAGGRKGATVDLRAPATATVALPSGEEVPANKPLEWEVPREAPVDWPPEAGEALAVFWEARIARQKEIDASIAAKADFECLYDKPYEDKTKVRVAGPFTVESLSPHRSLLIDEEDNLVDTIGEARKTNGTGQDFGGMILEQLRTAGVQQVHREDRIKFTSLSCWPGRMIAAEGSYVEAGSGDDRRAGILVGPEFGSVTRPDLVEAAREAADAGFDVLISCAFSYDAHASEFSKLGRIPVLKARMNADLHMAEDLKNTGKGNLFVIFGEPDIDILPVPDENGGEERFQVKLNGVDVFDPRTGKVRSDSADGIACWFIDTDYDGESFFVRHAYFLGANDPYKSLKTSLRAEIDREAWETLHRDISRPFTRPRSGRIAVKVINHLGDEVMKVFRP